MFVDNSVFIIGAGASADFGLPLGSKLMDRIKDNCFYRLQFGELKQGIPQIINGLQDRYRTVEEYEPYFKALMEIHRAIDFSGSIDEFVNKHYDDPHIAKIGKLQIAYAIAKAEEDARWIMPRFEGIRKKDQDPTTLWIRNFTRLLFEGVRNDQVNEVGHNITIICFNYDRCIEQYLQEAIVEAFRGVSLEQAQDIVTRMNIIHPYGTLGRLKDFPFGTKFDTEKLWRMSDNIVTWSEFGESRTKNKIEAAMRAASNIVFMGLAFAPQNMQLLQAAEPNGYAEDVTVYATGYGYDRVIDDKLRSKIANLFGMQPLAHSQIHVQYEMMCGEFLQKHSMALVK